MYLTPEKPRYRNKDDFPESPELFSKEKYFLLVDALNWHSYLYYTLDAPEIMDADYDEFMFLLQKLEDKHPDWKRPDSPTQKIGGEIREGFPKVEHAPPMMSLTNAADLSEFLAFHERVRKNILNGKDIIYHCEPKFDGLGVELIYEDAVLTCGSTRGNGHLGEDITHNIRTIRNVPLRLLLRHPPDLLSIRGECVLPISEFERINKKMQSQGKDLFANPRNMAAGTLRQLDSSLVSQRRIKFFPYSVGKVIENARSQTHNPCPKEQSLIYSDYLPASGLPTFDLSNTLSRKILGDVHVVQKVFEEWKVRRSEFDFDTDGLVIKLNDIQSWEKLGKTSKSPRYAIALKFPPRSAFTEIEGVSFQVGRTGVVTPVASLKPVNIGGVIVKRASLHNHAEIEKLNIMIGDLVEVQRAGDVIPKVIALRKKKKNSKKIQFPQRCPSCEKELHKEKIYYRCLNNDCSDKNLANLIYITSKSGLDIEGLGQEWVAKLYAKGLIKNIADIFSLTVEKIQDIKGMGEILPQKIISSINAKKKVSLEAFLRALGIPHIGGHIAEVLAQNFESLEKLRQASLGELTAIHEIGQSVAQSILNFFQNDHAKEILNRLFQTGFEIESAQKPVESHPLFQNKTFIFTGGLKTMTRQQAQEVIKAKGGRISSSISSKTDYIIAGEKSGSKLIKANELGVSVLTEEQFLSMLAEETD